MIADQKSTIQYFLPRVIYWFIGAVFAVSLSATFIREPEQTLIAIALLATLLLTYKYQRLGLYAIILLPIMGELARVPFGPAGDVLITDLFIPLFLIGWVAKNIFRPLSPLPKGKLLVPFALFVGAATLSIIQSLSFLPASEVGSGSLYLIRFIQYGLLYFVTLQIIHTQKQAANLMKVLIASALLLALAGFIQLGVYPDLAELEEQGYDPHINRLVSTWLDPNFVGGFLAFIISILLGVMLHAKKLAGKFGLLVIIAILGTALFLTYSRSAYLALAAGVLIISLLKSRKILIISLALFLIGVSLSPRAQERVDELAQSATSLVFSSADTPDPTAKLRIQSWQQTWELIQKRPLLGSGYNNLRAVNYREGYIKDPQIHSGSGSDSSLLTILATTGIAGFVPFILLYLIPMKTAWQNWRNKKSPGRSRGYSLGLFGGIIALFVHSVFVNSLLFPPMLIFFWISAALLELPSTAPNKQNS